MHIEVKTPLQLSDSERQRWQEILDANPALDSPFFRPEFAAAVGSVRDDVRVAIVRRDQQIIGFFPYQQFSRGIGKPLAGRLSDFQAIIASPGDRIDPRDLVSACGLLAWDFDHLLNCPDSFAVHQHFADYSPFIGLGEGYEHFAAIRKQLGGGELKQTLRKARKLAREVGPLRLEPLITDSAVIEQAFAWKSDQYVRSRITNVFSFPWTRQLLRALVETPERDGFGGCMSAIFAGDTLAAVHLGMRCHGVWHYWFPTYNPELSDYSPGRVLLVELCRNCRPLGIDRIDLGRGVSQFKRQMMTGVAQVGVGSVDLRPVGRLVRAGWRQTRNWVRQSPLRAPARAPARAIYRIKEWLEFK